MIGFRKVIEGRKFIFELLPGDEQTEAVFLVSTKMEQGQPISFGMSMCNETCWCFTTNQLPEEIKTIREKLSNAILASRY